MLLDTTSVRVFVLLYFLWILIMKLGFSDIFKDPLNLVRMLNFLFLFFLGRGLFTCIVESHGR